jgi:hypothetical protein
MARRFLPEIKIDIANVIEGPGPMVRFTTYVSVR